MHRRSLAAVVVLMGVCFLISWRLLPVQPAKSLPPLPPRSDAVPAVTKQPIRTIHLPRVNYQRDIQPLFASRCYACHGPAAESDMAATSWRLDNRAEVIRTVIVPGNSGKSRLLARLNDADPEQRMPPPGGNRSPLSAEQIDLVRRWIDEGAPYAPHWSFTPFKRPTVPVGHPNEERNPIDAFVVAEQQREGLRPSPAADRVTLIRRLSFDLTGLPPSPEDVDQFVHADTTDAYGQLVERLLASPHFGERLAVLWLDLVRYADTDGYSMDNHRDMWMYRDFVIDAFNRNRPFDRFTIQQLAGDLLPQATREDRVGSGYNRLLMTSQEGCADPKEYTHRYAADRVRNVASVWLGVTLGCAECHDHKFDPFSSRDFYRLAAFFADVQEKGVGPLEFTRFFSDAQQEAQLARLDKDIAEAEKAVVERERELTEARTNWEARAKDNSRLPKDVRAALLVEAARRSPEEQTTIALLFRTVAPELQSLNQPLLALQKQRAELLQRIPATLLTTAGPLREVRVRPRGNWADDSGEIVAPGYPEVLTMVEPSGERLTRLNLARWLVAPDNPLVARVFVSRLWQLAFGRGLVTTPEDFGSRGALPTHPELLDWLAADFIASGWDVKHMLRLIVTSDTYRLASEATADALLHDPDNRWLTHQNQFRLEAEFVRDNALAISGLLVPRVGGRSVKPYQPDGFWASRFTEKEYQPSTGPDQYRRGLYTYWCRNYLHPALQAFDAPSRQNCVACRGESSTPFQALVLLNDPTYLEAARAFADRILREGGSTTAGRLEHAMRLAQSRELRPGEAAILRRVLEKHRAEFADDRSAATALLAVGAGSVPDDMDVVELAAWTSVARILLNLHDTVTRK
jgi:hypothetical protein